MRTKYIRDAFRNPVACVVSTGPGRVGWSAYHPNDYVEVPKLDYVGVDAETGKPVMTNRLDEKGVPVMYRKRVSFSKDVARKVACERELDNLHDAVVGMDNTVPEGRRFSRWADQKCSLVADDTGEPVAGPFYRPVLKWVDLKDELAFWIEAMHVDSLQGVESQEVV